MTRIRILRGDITQLDVDAIVNAANSSLLGGEGVDGAIHRAAGPELRTACRALGGCETGEAKITPGYRLPARFVIHTVGPIYGQTKGQDARLLAGCYRNCLQIALNHGLRTLAFPSISTGAYGYPIDEASQIAVDCVLEFSKTSTSLEEVIFVTFSESDRAAYERALASGNT